MQFRVETGFRQKNKENGLPRVLTEVNMDQRKKPPMNSFNPNNSNEGDWEDKEELAWSEADWSQYLGNCMREVGNFLNLYEHSNRDPGHLDEIARHMGWEVSDWSSKEGYPEDEMPEFPSLEEPEEDFEPAEPYTLHRHPVYIVTQGLFIWLRKTFENYLQSEHGQQLSARLSWKYSSVLQDAEHQALMGVQALDMADYSLSICHFKRALSAINQTMTVLGNTLTHKAESQYRDEIHARLFDLREVYLRIIGECRYFENGDFGETF